MSAATARAVRSAPRPASAPAGYLRLVAARRSNAARAPFVAVVVGILGLGLLGLLLLNTVLAQDAFRLHALQVQGHRLADQEQGLQREVEQLQSPQSLAAHASALGMVQGGPPAFLRLSDGKVLGAPEPGHAAPPPIVAAAAAPAAAATPTTSRAKPAAPAAGAWVLVPPSSTAHSRNRRVPSASGGHR